MHKHIIEDAGRLSFSELLKKRIRIPPYQRFYEWTPELVEKLLEDILRAKDSDENYWVGSIIAKKGDGEFILIDGQQRLLTLLILLRSLCDFIKAAPTQQHLFKTINVRLNHADVTFSGGISIDLNEDYQAQYFRETILKGNESVNDELEKAGKNFRRSREVYEDFLPGALSSWKIAPKELYEYIANRLELVEIDLAKVANESEIFEAINSKRKELTSIDNLKNFLFQISDPHSRWDDVDQLWLNLRRGFNGARDLEMFIGVFATSTAFGDKEYSTKKKRLLVDAFQKLLSMKANAKTVPWRKIKSLFHRLDFYKKNYLALTDYKIIHHKKRYSKTERLLRNKIYFLTHNKYTSHLPFILAAAEKKKSIKKKEILQLLGYAELIHFSNRLSGDVLPQETKDFFNACLKSIKHSALKKALHKMEKKATNRKINDAISEISARTSKSFDDRIRYVLKRIIAANAPELLERTFRDLEHIFPQSMPKKGSGWDKIMLDDISSMSWNKEGESAPIGMKKKIYLEKYALSLGNCCLLISDENSSLQTDPFAIKLKGYKQEDPNLTLQNVLRSKNKKNWNYRDMRENSKWLANKFIESVLKY